MASIHFIRQLTCKGNAHTFKSSLRKHNRNESSYPDFKSQPSTHIYVPPWQGTKRRPGLCVVPVGPFPALEGPTQHQGHLHPATDPSWMNFCPPARCQTGPEKRDTKAPRSSYCCALPPPRDQVTM